MTTAEISVTAIRPSPTNPRKYFNPVSLNELADSIDQVGLINPITVRPVPPKEANGIMYELVAGERRWRGSKIAKKPTITALIKELTDEQVLEIQLIENDSREDVKPVEQGRAYRRLHDDFKHSVEDIAEKTGRSTKYIRDRMSLGSLCAAAEKALDEDEINFGVALQLARMPAALQPDALKKVLPRFEGQPTTVASARSLILQDFMRPLGKAPFDTASTSLTKAPACHACPKRTGAQAELFADVKSDNLCTDTACYKAKVDAHWVNLSKDAKASGQQLLTEAETKKAFYPDSRGGEASLKYDSGFVKADERPWEIGNGKKTWKQVLGKDFKPVIAKAPSGEIVELVPKTVADKAKKAAGRSTPSATTSSTAAEKRRKREAQIEKRTAQKIGGELARLGDLIDVSSTKKLDTVVYAATFAIMNNSRWRLEEVAKRRGVKLAQLDEQNGTIGLLLECAVATASPAVRAAVCKAFGVDDTAIAKAVAAELAPKVAKPAKKKTTAKKTK